MLKIITNVPLFVWPLFAILFIGGLKARKTNLVPLKALLLIPSAFLVWSIFSLSEKFRNDPLAILFWVVCLGVGFFIGFFHIRRMGLRFDKKKMRIEMPGSWIPLILSMSVFFSKFITNMMQSISVSFYGSTSYKTLEFVSAVVLGIMAGRSVSCLIRYRASERENEIQDL